MKTPPSETPDSIFPTDISLWQELQGANVPRASLLTVVFLAFLLTVGVFLLPVGSLFLTFEALLFTVGSVSKEQLNGL